MNYAFGQHSGVIDINKDKFELPRFPINEKYGDLDRFKFLITYNLKLKLVTLDKILTIKIILQILVEFFKQQKNLKILIAFQMKEMNGKIKYFF